MDLKLEDLKIINENIDLDRYILFREYVKQYMECPQWLGDFSKEDLITLLETGSKIWMYYFENDPVCSMMFIPSDENSVVDFELNIDHKEMADYGPMMVNPKYIGNNLQYQMLKKLDEYSIEKDLNYAVATAHPNNIFSINNLVKDNFEIIKQKEFKRGLRNVYLKKL